MKVIITTKTIITWCQICNECLSISYRPGGNVTLFLLSAKEKGWTVYKISNSKEYVVKCPDCK